MPHDDFSDRKGVPEGQNDDQLGPSHQGQPRATILAIYGRAVARVSNRAKLERNSTVCVRCSKIDFNRAQPFIKRFLNKFRTFATRVLGVNENHKRLY